MASRSGHFSIVKLLIESGCDLEHVTASGFSALHVAVTSASKIVSEVFKQRAATLMRTVAHGDDVRLCVVKMEDNPIGCLEVLLENGAKADTKDNSNRTPLMHALRSNLEADLTWAPHTDEPPTVIYNDEDISKRLQVLELLLNMGNVDCDIPGYIALPGHRKANTYTPLQYTLYTQDFMAMKILVEAGADTRCLRGCLVDIEPPAWVHDVIWVPSRLMSLSKRKIRRLLGNRLWKNKNSLPLPDTLKNFVVTLRTG